MRRLVNEGSANVIECVPPASRAHSGFYENALYKFTFTYLLTYWPRTFCCLFQECSLLNSSCIPHEPCHCWINTEQLHGVRCLYLKWHWFCSPYVGINVRMGERIGIFSSIVVFPAVLIPAVLHKLVRFRRLPNAHRNRVNMSPSPRQCRRPCVGLRRRPYKPTVESACSRGRDPGAVRGRRPKYVSRIRFRDSVCGCVCVVVSSGQCWRLWKLAIGRFAAVGKEQSGPRHVKDKERSWVKLTRFLSLCLVQTSNKTALGISVCHVRYKWWYWRRKWW